MKRVLCLLALAFCVVALTSFNTASAGPQERVKICHCNPDGDEGLPAMFVIEVAQAAIDGHLGHGDCLNYAPQDAAVYAECACVVAPSP